MPARETRPFHRGLDRRAVLTAGLQVLHAEGRAALTMRRLARELDVEPASLYTHVRGKDDLIDGMVGIVLERVVLPDPGADWRTELVDGFTAYRQTLVAHPAIVSLMTERTRFSEAQLRLVTRSIELLESSGLSTTEAVRTQVALFAFTLGFVVQEIGQSAAIPAEALASNETLRRAVQALLDISVDQRFRAGLDLILDGSRQRALQ